MQENIYISFHPDDKEKWEFASDELKFLLKRYFHSKYEPVYLSEIDNEIIIKVVKPSPYSEHDNIVFFKGLESLFNATKHLYPHFTKYIEAKGDENEEE